MPRTYSDLTDAQKEARREYYKEYHKRPERAEKLRQKQVNDQKIRKKKIKTLVFAYKDKPCTDCGVHLPPQIMELDHVRGKKVIEISKVIAGKRYLTWKELEDELKKCDVRCPNCHRLRHYKLGYYGSPGEETADARTR